MKKIILLVISSLAILSSCTQAEDTGRRSVGIVAHKGFWNCEEAGYAQNSIASLRCAQEAGFWGSEFDVNMTSDSVLLVYHDSRIEGMKIERHPYSRFKDIRLDNGERIPTVDDYLRQGLEHPETMLVYELKKHSSDEVEDILVRLSIGKLKEHGLLDPERVMFISFSLHICERLAGMLPGFTVQYLGAGCNPDRLAAKGISGVDYNHLIFSIHNGWYHMARKNGMSVNAWTVNKKSTMEKMFRMGVDQITTDQPLEARQLLESMGYEEE